MLRIASAVLPCIALAVALAGCGPDTSGKRSAPRGMPEPPTDLVAKPVAGGIELTWKDNSDDEWGFRLERGPSPAGPWALVANVSAGTTKVVDTSPGSSPHYVVMAYNGFGYSGGSNVAVIGGATSSPSSNNGNTDNPPSNNNPPSTQNRAPTVSILAPTSHTAPANVTINATATDDGTVARVEFYEGTNLLGADNTSPFSYSWQNVPAGRYSLKAKAFDDQGASGESDALSITVTAPAAPAFGVTSLTLINADNDQPVAGFDPIPNNATISFAAVGTMNLTIRANTTGTIGSVKFTMDGADVRTENMAPYSLSGDNMGDYPPFTFAQGAHTLTATAYDMAMAAGQAGGAATVSFTIQQ